MTDTARSKASRRTARSGGQAITAALVFLGVVASVILLATDSVVYLRVGIVVAAWAAVIGAMAMTKYRRDSTTSQMKARDLQTVYELQLEREIAARREYELGVEARVRGEIGSDSGELRALRTELASLRRSLEVLFDGALPEDRAAIAGEAQRMREIADRSYSSYQPAASGLYVPGSVGAAFTPEPAYARAPFATPFDEPVTAETSVVFGEASAYSATPTPDPGYTESAFTESAYTESEYTEAAYTGPSYDDSPYSDADYASPYSETPPADIPEFDVPAPDETQKFEAQKFEAQKFEAQKFEASFYSAQPYAGGSYDVSPTQAPGYSDVSTPSPTSTAAPTAESVAEVPEPEPEFETSLPSRHSRRRAPEPHSEPISDSAPDVVPEPGAHSSGRSVADILADMNSNRSEPTTTVRRRRRAE